MLQCWRPQSPPLAAGFLDCSKRPPLVARLQLQALAPELGFVQHTDGYARPDTSDSSAYEVSLQGGSTQASHTDAALVPHAARPCGAALTSPTAPRAPPLAVAVCAHSRACVLPGITGSSGYAPESTGCHRSRKRHRPSRYLEPKHQQKRCIEQTCGKLHLAMLHGFI